MAVDVDDPDLAEFIELSKLGRVECSVSVVLRDLNDDDRRKLEAALASDEVRHAAISKWLAKRDYRVGGQTISRHRKGECHCHE